MHIQYNSDEFFRTYYFSFFNADIISYFICYKGNSFNNNDLSFYSNNGLNYS